jgi:histone acetyltransferase (RNA polymerase elongator complex component)
VAELAPAFTRIYPTLVIKGSPLAALYQKGKYLPQSLDDAVEQAAAMFQVFQKNNIPVVRMGLQAEDGLIPGKTVLAGPYHPAFGQLVYSRIYYKKVTRLLDAREERPEHLTVYVNPKEISKFRGDKNGNIERLTNAYGFKRIPVKADDNMAAGDLRLSFSMN